MVTLDFAAKLSLSLRLGSLWQVTELHGARIQVIAR